jgi:hypothetical protein
VSAEFGSYRTTARQAFNVNGRLQIFGGVVIYANGGGRGLMDLHYKAADKHGIEIRYSTRRHVAFARRVQA